MQRAQQLGRTGCLRRYGMLCVLCKSKRLRVAGWVSLRERGRAKWFKRCFVDSESWEKKHSRQDEGRGQAHFSSCCRVRAPPSARKWPGLWPLAARPASWGWTRGIGQPSSPAGSFPAPRPANQKQTRINNYVNKSTKLCKMFKLEY